MSSCGTGILEIRQRYPRTAMAIFISSQIKEGEDESTHIADTHDGYIIELEKLAMAYSAPGGKSKTDPATGPYTTLLRPACDLDPILNCQEAYLDKVEAFPFDSTLDGSAEQDATTNALIYGSRTTNDAYPQSQFRNAIVMTHQPNWYRPEILINTKNFLEGMGASNFGTKQNKGDLSIGLPLGQCHEIAQPVGQVNNIEIYAQCVQKVGAKYLRYPIVMVCTFWLSPT